ncbi:MAG: hypothetical protein QOF93_1087 [Verrucomicrobiota bacterium]
MLSILPAFTGYGVAGEQLGAHLSAGCAINSGSTGDCPQNGSRHKDADALRADVLRSR